VRETPLPLLRNLPPDMLVVRCGLCNELVLAVECCSDVTHAPLCPRRAVLEGVGNWGTTMTKLLVPSARLGNQ